MKSHDCVCPSYHGICDWFSLPLFYPKFNMNLLNVRCFMCTETSQDTNQTQPERKFEMNKEKKKILSETRRRKNREQAREEESVLRDIRLCFPAFYLSFNFFPSHFNANILNLLRQDSTFRVRFLFYHQMLSLNIRCDFSFFFPCKRIKYIKPCVT